MVFYYSIANVIPDLNNHYRFFVNDPETLEELYKIFNEVEEYNSVQLANSFQIKITNSAEDEFLIDEGYRNLSNDQIYEIIASTEPSEYNASGSRVDIMSARLLSIFKKREIKEIISVPVKLINPLSGRLWENFFAIRFTGVKNRMKVRSEALFVDDKTNVTWFNEDIMLEIDAINLPDISFSKMLPKKFP